MARTIGTALALVAMLLANACDPLAYLYVRQPLQPAPAMDCLTAALFSSPEHVRVARVGGDPLVDRRWITLRDSTTGKNTDATIARDTTDVTVTFVWGGHKALFGPPATEVQARAALATRLLAHIRTQCAPDAPEEVECKLNDRQVSCHASAT